VTDVVEAARFNTQVEADLARLYLQSEGVESVLFDSGHHSMWGLIGGLFMPVRLMVLDEDLEEARRLLSDYKP
jgi:hypothetical protein